MPVGRGLGKACCCSAVLCFLSGADIDKALLLQNTRSRSCCPGPRCCAGVLCNSSSSSGPGGARVRHTKTSKGFTPVMQTDWYDSSCVYQSQPPGRSKDHWVLPALVVWPYTSSSKNGLLRLMHLCYERGNLVLSRRAVL